jgi:hypothetical protein
MTSGGVLLLIGAVAGWLAPRNTTLLGWLPALGQVATGTLDVSGFLSAAITALAVIIAVVIGFNATALQIAGQTHALPVVRGILFSQMPFLLCWGLVTAVSLIYFLAPPLFAGQLWQMLFWFAAVVLLMLSYLWRLPWRLSGAYVAEWVIRELRGRPIERWEAQEAFSAAQTTIAAACDRGDLGTVRALTTALGSFLAGRNDPRAEQQPVYQRERYRALKNLLSGSARQIAEGPHAAAYYLGYLLAGDLLQATAVGLALDDPSRDFFSGMFRALGTAPERTDPLWTGMRHALCRRGAHGEPYLLRYWREHPGWADDDPRPVASLVSGLIKLHGDAHLRMRQAGYASAEDDAAAMLADLYRDLATHLAPEVARLRQPALRATWLKRCLTFVETAHTSALAAWQSRESSLLPARVMEAYSQRAAELLALLDAR